MIDHDIRSYEMIARVFDGEAGRADARRRPRQRHALLADEHRDLVGAPLLGHRAQSAAGRLLRREGHQDPGRRERLRRGDLPGAAELGGEGVSQAHPLQQAPQGRPFRGVGTAGVLRLRDACSVQVTAQHGSEIGGGAHSVRAVLPIASPERSRRDRQVMIKVVHSWPRPSIACRRLRGRGCAFSRTGRAACDSGRRYRNSSVPGSRSRSRACRAPPTHCPTRWPDKETVTDQSQGARWPNCRSWSATGAAATTGARRKRS